MVSCSYGLRLLFILVILTIFYIIGIFLFTHGFLLNRLVIPKHSSCEDDLRNISSFPTRDEINKTCWITARFKRAVVVVIDALRYDFMVYNESLAEKEAESFQNKLKVIHDLLTVKPQHGKLFKFVADPPTTTMQRIKGLTTGSLPTFIDAGSNFASSEIFEDNIIFQLKNVGKNLVFMGDDTWLGLFPNSFQRYYPFPSFNVKDLHTVDNGVISHLIPEMRRNDWDIIIAHFLGVDHCGHRHGPYHEAMANKLSQMNQVLRSVINNLDNETLLLVFGDHGMTKTGDHGGDSPDEVHAGLFVYSSMKSFGPPQLDEDLVVSQTDIVPTLALLLGVPIPFANLGVVPTSLFEDTRKPLTLPALQLNARQVHRYLTEYSKLSSDISQSALKSLTNLFLDAEQLVFSNAQTMTLAKDSMSLKNVSLAEKDYLAYLHGVRELCRSVWARFDLASIIAGIFVVTVSCLAGMFTIISREPFHDLQLWPPSSNYSLFSFLLAVFVSGIILSCGYTAIVLAVLVLYATLVFSILLRKGIQYSLKNAVKSWRVKGCTIALVLSVYFLAFFSNSFVVHEDEVVSFLLQTTLLISLIDFLRNANISKLLKFDNSTKTQRGKGGKKVNFAAVVFSEIKMELLFLIILLVLTRLGQVFWFCREEQILCESSSFVKLSTFLTSNDTQLGYRFWISSALICLVPVSLILRLGSFGNLNGYSCTVLCTKYALPLGSFVACVHWLLQFVPAKMISRSPTVGFLQQILTPCVVYLCSGLTLLSLIYQPLTIYFVYPHESSDLTGNELVANTIVEIFKRLRSKLSDENCEKDERLPIVYGLGTVYSSAICIFLVCFSLPIALILGDGLSSSVTLMLLQMFLFLELYTALTVSETISEETTGSFVYPVVTWFLMSSHYFFSSGHQPTIPSIRFEAAFVGLPGDMESFLLPGFLILVNTFASDILFTTSLPLILFCCKKSSRERKNVTSDFDAGEFVYGSNPDRLRSEVFRICVLYQVCKGFKLLGTMCAAGVHRRHLMVWKIFAPRFIFEGVSFILTSVMLCLVFLFVLRVDNVLMKWQLELHSERRQRRDKQNGRYGTMVA